MTSTVRKIKQLVFGDENKKILIKKFSGVFVVRVIGSLLGFASHIILARLMGASEYGIYVYVFSWITLISLFSRIGFDNYLIRNISHYVVKKDWSRFKGLLKFSNFVVIAVSLFIGISASIILWNFDQVGGNYTQPFIIGFLIVLPSVTLAYLQRNILVGLKYVDLADIPILILKHVLIITLIGGAYYYFQGIAASEAMAITGFALITIVAVGSYLILKRMPYEGKVKEVIYEPLNWIKETLSFLSISAATTLNQKGDLVILGLLATSDQVGIYSASLKLMVVISFASNIVNTLIKPYISSYFSENKLEKVEKIIFYSAIFVAFCVIILAGVFIFWGENILQLFGSEFISGYPILLIFLLGKVIAVLTGPVSILLIMTNNHILASKIETSFAVIYILLTIILVKIYGAIGAAFSTAIIDSVKNLIQLYFAHDRTNINPTVFNIELFNQLFSKIFSKA